MSDALAPIDATIQATVQVQPLLWVDETSWREQSHRSWLWVAVSLIATCFRIAASRSQAALRRLIGDSYGGIVHSDRGSAYHALSDRQRQGCWGHLLRNMQGLVDHQHDESIWAQRMLSQGQQLFVAWRAYRSGLFDQVALQQALMAVRLALHELLTIGVQRPWSKLQALCRNLLRHWDALLSAFESSCPTILEWIKSSLSHDDISGLGSLGYRLCSTGGHLMSTIKHLFWDHDEDRLRAGWRILVYNVGWFILLYGVFGLINAVFTGLCSTDGPHALGHGHPQATGLSTSLRVGRESPA